MAKTFGVGKDVLQSAVDKAGLCIVEVAGIEPYDEGRVCRVAEVGTVLNEEGRVEPKVVGSEKFDPRKSAETGVVLTEEEESEV